MTTSKKQSLSGTSPAAAWQNSPSNMLNRVLKRYHDEHRVDSQSVSWICHDPCLASHVLRAVNSTVNGFPRQMTSVHQSLKLMGPHFIQRLLLDVEDKTALDASIEELEPSAQEALWQMATRVGVFAEQLAELLGDVSPEDAFSAGLLHNIGDYAKQGQFPVLSDDDITMMNSVSVGMMLAEQWNFSQALHAVIQYQDAPQTLPEGEASVADLVMTVATAKRLVRDMTLSPAMYAWLLTKKPLLARDGDEFCSWRERFTASCEEVFEQRLRAVSK